MVFKKEVFSNQFTDVESSEENGKKGDEDSDTPKNTYFDALANNFRSTVGTGILALPKSFSQCGYIGSILGIILVTFITNYCALILVSCQRELKKRRKDMVSTYQGTVEAAFAEGPASLRKFSPCILAATNIFLLVAQIGGVCVELIFISTNIKAAAYPYLDMDVRYFELLIFIPALIVSLIPNMKKMSLFSMFGNISLFVSIVVVMCYIFQEPISFEGRYPFGNPKDLPKFFGTIFYSAVTISLILPMENEMKRPGMLEGTFGVLNVTAYSCCLLYIFFGFVGYLKYVIVSILVPDLQLVLSVLGIISQCTLSTTMPSIIHILTYYKQPSLWAYARKFWLDAVTFIFTIIVLVLSFISRFMDD